MGSKLDQFQRVPFGCFKQVIKELLLDILSRSASAVREWKKKILDVIGTNGALLTAMFPLLEELIGVQPEPAALPPTESQLRLMLLFSKFICVFASKERPLALFFDDLQWADRNSLQQITSFCTDPNFCHMIVLAAYRNDEVDSFHPLLDTVGSIQAEGIPVKNIELINLKLSHVADMLVDSLHCSIEKVMPLASVLHSKSKGNPFFTIQLMETLSKEKMIKYVLPLSSDQTGEWHWDLKQIQSNYQSDVVEFVKDRIMKLSATNRHLLSLASCIGDTFQLETLSVVSEKSILELLPAFLELQRAGLTIPVIQRHSKSQPPLQGFSAAVAANQIEVTSIEATQNYITSMTFSFLHDRVQQAAYEMLSSEQKSATHLQIARLLLAAAEKDAELMASQGFDIANHFNSALTELVITASREEKEKIIDFFYTITLRAKANAAYLNAFAYCQAGIYLLGLSPHLPQAFDASEINSKSTEEKRQINWKSQVWNTHYSIAYGLILEFAELYYLCGDATHAKITFTHLLEQTNDMKEKADVYHHLITLSSSSSAFADAIQLYSTLR